MLIVVAKDGERSIGVVVDELMEQQEFVVKPLASSSLTSGHCGATILVTASGTDSDVPALIKMATPELNKGIAQRSLV